MPGFDWNGNGKSDAFDHFMDMKVMTSSSGNDSDELEIDTDIDDSNDGTDDDIELHRASLASSLRSVYNSASGDSHMTTGGIQSTSFQDELKKNMRTPETVRQENAERERSSAIWEAQRTLDTIKKLLLNKVQNAEYVKQNGVTSVSCTCDINHRYLRKRSYNNGNQLRENQKKSFLFRDPNLVYRTWDVFDVEPKYASEYNNFMAALREIASKENITIEPILLNGKNGVYAFPSTQDRIFGYTQLCVKATTIIAVDPNYKPTTTETQTQSPKATEAKTTQARQDDNATTIVKSVLCVAVCLIAFAICLSGGIGKLGMALIMIGAAVLGYFIMKK